MFARCTSHSSNANLGTCIILPFVFLFFIYLLSFFLTEVVGRTVSRAPSLGGSSEEVEQLFAIGSPSTLSSRVGGSLRLDVISRMVVQVVFLCVSFFRVLFFLFSLNKAYHRYSLLLFFFFFLFHVYVYASCIVSIPRG